MRTRLGTSLAVAAVAVLWASPPARAGYFGATKYTGTPQPVSESQTNFAAGQAGCQPGYQVVYDNVVEKRYHTVYQDSCETVRETADKQVTETVCRPVCETVMKECRTTVCKPVCETVMKECRTTCYKKCEETCYKECCYKVCKQVCDP